MLSAHIVLGQSDVSFQIENYGYKEGLNNLQVNAIVHHTAGFVWVGTDAGLSRFDGYAFLNFRNPLDSSANNPIRDLFQLASGQLIIFYDQPYYDVFDVYTHQYRRVSYLNNKGELAYFRVATQLENSEVYFVADNKSSLTIYHVTQQAKHQKWLDIREDRSHYFRYPQYSLAAINGQDSVELWLAENHKGLRRFMHGKPLPFGRSAPKFQIKKSNSSAPYPFLRIKRTSNCIYVFNENGDYWEWVENRFEKIGRRELPLIKTFQKYNEQLVGLQAKDIFSSDTIILFQSSGSNINIPFKSRWHLSISSPINTTYVWFGNHDGLWKINIDASPFRRHLYQSLRDSDLGHRVSGITEDLAGTIYFTTEETGIFKLPDSSTTAERLILNNKNHRDYIPYRSYSPLIDQNHFMWTGDYRSEPGRLLQININTADFKSYALDHFRINDLVEGNNQELVLSRRHAQASDGGDLLVFNRHSGSFDTLTGLETLLSNRTPNEILIRLNDTLIGTNNGIVRPGNMDIILPGTSINCIVETENKHFLIGTLKGLYLLDSNHTTISIFTQNDGLCNNQVWGIVPSDYRGYWISTSYGLSYFDRIENVFVNYYSEDGLNSNEFLHHAYYKSKSGQIYFGSKNGAVSFSERDLLEAENNDVILISQVEYFVSDSNQLISVENWSPDEIISLPASNRYLGLKLALSNYSDVAKNTFTYMLTQGMTDWINVNDNNHLQFPQLPAGRYNLIIKATNNKNIESSNELVIQLDVKDFFFKTPLGFMLLFLVGTGVLAVFLSFYIRRRQLNLELAFQANEAERLKHLDDLKTSFFTNITHELRTPLTLILAPVKDLIEKTNDVQTLEKLHLVSKNGNHLLKLVNQLLDLSKIEADAMKIDPSLGDIVTFTEEIVERFRAMAMSKHIKLQLKSKEIPYALFDPEKLDKILSNLIQNAVKFTPDYGKISVTLLYDQTHSMAEWIIKDSGPGIAATEQEKIFNRFYQLESNSSTSGTGIGLAISKELSQLLGGEINIQSAIGKGSTFIVRLPLQIALDPSNSESEAVADSRLTISDTLSENERSVILIIEDNLDIRSYIYSFLHKNYVCIHADNGEEGLSLAQKHIPDIIISDIMMPKMDGIELLKILKSDIRTSHIPLILLTAAQNQATKLEGLSLGASAFLKKPFYSSELRIRIDELLKLRDRWRLSSKDGYDRGKQLQFPSKEEEFLEKARSIVIEYLADESFSVEHFAAKMGLSRSNLHRKIKALTGHSSSLFIRSIRLKRAYEQLLSGQGNVTEIAYATGFSSLQYFSRIFKETYGFNPQDVLLGKE